MCSCSCSLLVLCDGRGCHTSRTDGHSSRSSSSSSTRRRRCATMHVSSIKRWKKSIVLRHTKERRCGTALAATRRHHSIIAPFLLPSPPSLPLLRQLFHFVFKTANGPYLARHASIEQLRGWNESLKYEADSNLLQRAVQANMNIVKDVGIGFVKLEFDINLKNPWHLWFRENSYRTEFNGSCLTGTQGVNCETCDDRHAGFLCAQCNLEHFGPRCQPCNCSESMICSATIVGDGKCRSRADIMFVNIVDNWCSLLFLAAASFALVCCLICPRRITVEKMH